MEIVEWSNLVVFAKRYSRMVRYDVVFNKSESVAIPQRGTPAISAEPIRTIEFLPAAVSGKSIAAERFILAPEFRPTAVNCPSVISLSATGRTRQRRPYSFPGRSLSLHGDGEPNLFPIARTTGEPASTTLLNGQPTLASVRVVFRPR